MSATQVRTTMMPRISEKARLTTQLEDLWLIEAVENILLLQDNLEPVVLFGISSASYPALVDERSRVGLGGGLESGAGRTSVRFGRKGGWDQRG